MKVKVFVPMSDVALGVNGDLYQQLVPFDPAYLVPGEATREGCKPRNWISESDRKQARERLYANSA